MRTVTHPQHQKDFDAGYNAKVAEINEMGLKAAHRKLLADTPTGSKPSTLAAYYYADGENHAVCDNR